MIKATKKGFTLVELLIASTIFALVMMMALSTFAWAASYNAKLKEIRNVTGDAKSIISEISKDVRLANGSSGIGTADEIGEISFVSCAVGASGVNCDIMPTLLDTIQNSGDAASGDHLTCRGVDCWNGVYILQKSQNRAIIYYSETVDPNFRVKKAVLDYDSSITGINNSKFSTLNHDNSTSVRVDFYGRAVAKTGRVSQPFLSIEVNSRSWNFASLESRSRYDFQFETTIETRDYSLI